MAETAKGGAKGRRGARVDATPAREREKDRPRSEEDPEERVDREKKKGK